MKLLKDGTNVSTPWAEVPITDNLVISDATAPTDNKSLCRKVDITSGILSTDANYVYTCLKCEDGYTLTNTPTVLPCVENKSFKGYFEDSITSTIIPIETYAKNCLLFDIANDVC